MITVTKLRNGVNFEYQDTPYRVLDYKHTHMSRGGGTVRVKIRDLITGSVLTKTFPSTEKVQEADVLKKPYQYLYKDGTQFIFMDPVTFEQIEVAQKIIADQDSYLKEGEQVNLLFWSDNDQDQVLGLDLPPKLTFEVTEAAPGEKGDSASNVYKDALLENGLKVRVPLFINKGDKVRVDTRTGQYVERA